MNCPNCNATVPPAQKKCISCGCDLTVTPPDPSKIIVPCPECGKPTDSLKVYRLPAVWVSLLVYLRYSFKGHVACPSCMRKKILFHGFTYNIITGNVYWALMIVPWSLVNLLRTLIKGHSKEVVRALKNSDGWHPLLTSECMWNFQVIECKSNLGVLRSSI